MNEVIINFFLRLFKGLFFKLDFVGHSSISNLPQTDDFDTMIIAVSSNFFDIAYDQYLVVQVIFFSFPTLLFFSPGK